MTDWQTYRNGNPRNNTDLQRLARHRAAKLGYRVHLHKASSTVLLGAGFTATVESMLEFIERERQ